MEKNEIQESLDKIGDRSDLIKEVLRKLDRLDQFDATIDEMINDLAQMSKTLGRVSITMDKTHASMEEITSRPRAIELFPARLPEKRLDKAEKLYWKETVGRLPEGKRQGQNIGRDCFVMLPYEGGYTKLKM